jgi:ubiquinone/menaquinone biosynthesis C-methylase UbiE
MSMTSGNSAPDINLLEQRKREEIEFHNQKRMFVHGTAEHEEHYPGVKFYSINRNVHKYIENWLSERCVAKDTLVYGCGDGGQSFQLANHGAASVTGIDIAENSIKKAKEQAETLGLADRISFQVMDCENLSFPDDSMDIIVAAAVLHHLDLPRAYAEMARVLRASGSIICVEPLAHNPLIQYYRRRTPEQRTPWEIDHILKMKDVRLAGKFFNRVEARFFNLFTLLAVPFRKSRGFSTILGALEALDSVALQIPLVRSQAWQVGFVLSEPKKV